MFGNDHSFFGTGMPRLDGFLALGSKPPKSPGLDGHRTGKSTQYFSGSNPNYLITINGCRQAGPLPVWRSDWYMSGDHQSPSTVFLSWEVCGDTYSRGTSLRGPPFFPFVHHLTLLLDSRWIVTHVPMFHSPSEALVLDVFYR